MPNPGLLRFDNTSRYDHAQRIVTNGTQIRSTMDDTTAEDVRWEEWIHEDSYATDVEEPINEPNVTPASPNACIVSNPASEHGSETTTNHTTGQSQALVASSASQSQSSPLVLSDCSFNGEAPSIGLSDTSLQTSNVHSGGVMVRVPEKLGHLTQVSRNITCGTRPNEALDRNEDQAELASAGEPKWNDANDEDSAMTSYDENKGVSPSADGSNECNLADEAPAGQSETEDQDDFPSSNEPRENSYGDADQDELPPADATNESVGDEDPSFPPGKDQPGFVPIGMVGVGSVAQGNVAGLALDIRSKIVTAERNAVPPLTYPQIHTKYNAWGVSQDRLRGMKWEARHAPKDRPRTVVWTLASVSGILITPGSILVTRH